ncbi:MAG: hypothetical protein R6U21_08285 [Thermoplasmatota archaeon]
MLSEKLKKLDAYIQKIDQMRPIDVLGSSIDSFQQRQDESVMNASVELDQFSKEIIELIHRYQQKGISAEKIACQLYTDLLFFVRKTRILSYAEQLGIDHRLYKKQMDFLFKGKS